MRALGLIYPERDPNNKNIPSVKEQGLNLLEVFTPMIIMAPKGVPDSIISSLDTAYKNMTSHKAYVKFLKRAGLPSKYQSGPSTAKYYEELAKGWKPLVDELKPARKKKQ